MNDDTQLYDVLVIEDNENIINLFQVITKKFNLSIKYVRSMTDFFEIMKEDNYRYILCDLYSKHNKDAIIIAEVFSKIRLTRRTKGKIILFSETELSTIDKSFSSFDDQLKIDFSSIYSFFTNHFELRSINSLVQDENIIIQSVNA